MSRFLVVGGAHLDRRGRICGPLHLHASNPGRWEDVPGGGGFNAARNLARLGHCVRLIAPRGGDAAGEAVARAAAAAGVEDTPVTFLDRATPTYSAILDQAGDLVVALADMALYDVFSPRQCDRRALRDAVGAADAVLTDANLPEATLARLAMRCREAGRPLAAIAVSPAKAVRLKPILADLAICFMNTREAAVLGDPSKAGNWPAALRPAGLVRAVVTAGAEPAIVFSPEGEWRIGAAPAGRVVDVTGAGDAMAAATFAAMLDGLPPAEAARRGAAAASLAVESDEPAPPALSAAMLETRLSLVPPAAALHDALDHHQPERKPKP